MAFRATETRPTGVTLQVLIVYCVLVAMVCGALGGCYKEGMRTIQDECVTTAVTKAELQGCLRDLRGQATTHVPMSYLYYDIARVQVRLGDRTAARYTAIQGFLDGRINAPVFYVLDPANGVFTDPDAVFQGAEPDVLALIWPERGEANRAPATHARPWAPHR